jgi:hypothetical protein
MASRPSPSRPQARDRNWRCRTSAAAPQTASGTIVMTACVAILGWNFCRTDGARRVAPPRVRNGIIAQDFTRKGRKVLVMGRSAIRPGGAHRANANLKKTCRRKGPLRVRAWAAFLQNNALSEGRLRKGPARGLVDRAQKPWRYGDTDGPQLRSHFSELSDLSQ